jgi:hypothetical protein
MANPLMSKTLQAKLAEMMKNRSGGPRTDDPRPSNNNGNKSNPTNRRKIPYALKDCVIVEIDGKLCFQIETKQYLHLVLCGFFPDRSDIQVGEYMEFDLRDTIIDDRDFFEKTYKSAPANGWAKYILTELGVTFNNDTITEAEANNHMETHLPRPADADKKWYRPLDSVVYDLHVKHHVPLDTIIQIGGFDAKKLLAEESGHQPIRSKKAVDPELASRRKALFAPTTPVKRSAPSTGENTATDGAPSTSQAAGRAKKAKTGNL